MAQNEEPGSQGEVGDDRFVGQADLTKWSTRWGKALADLVQRLSKLLGPHGTLILTLFVGAVIAAAATFGAAKVYDAVTETEGVAGLDKPILNAAIAVRSPWLDVLATGYTDIGGAIIMTIITVAAIVFFAVRRKSWTPVILIAGTSLGSLLMTVAGKDLIGRNRPALVYAVPPFEYSPSFPSGHTLNATAIAGSIVYVLLLRESTRRSWIVTVTIGALFAFTIGLSRMYLGLHWFTDVLAAWMLGLAWLAIVITAHRLYLTVRKRQQAMPNHVASPTNPPNSRPDR